MYIMCVVLCLFSALSRRVGAGQISIIIIVIIIISSSSSSSTSNIRVSGSDKPTQEKVVIQLQRRGNESTMYQPVLHVHLWSENKN